MSAIYLGVVSSPLGTSCVSISLISLQMNSYYLYLEQFHQIHDPFPICLSLFCFLAAPPNSPLSPRFLLFPSLFILSVPFLKYPTTAPLFLQKLFFFGQNKLTIFYHLGQIDIYCSLELHCITKK